MTELVETFDMRFPVGSTHMVCGNSGVGKSERTAQILRHRDELFVDGDKIENVVYCYSAWQPLFDRMKKENLVTKWFQGVPTKDAFLQMVTPYRDSFGSIVVLDDSLQSLNEDMDAIVRVHSRHNKATTMLLFQNLFPPYKLARQLSINITYFHIMKNARDRTQIGVFFRQMDPKNWRSLVDIYDEITQRPYSAMLVDLHAATDERLRFRSNYLPHEAPMKVWSVKKK